MTHTNHRQKTLEERVEEALRGAEDAPNELEERMRSIFLRGMKQLADLDTRYGAARRAVLKDVLDSLVAVKRNG